MKAKVCKINLSFKKADDFLLFTIGYSLPVISDSECYIVIYNLSAYIIYIRTFKT